MSKFTMRVEAANVEFEVQLFGEAEKVEPNNREGWFEGYWNTYQVGQLAVALTGPMNVCGARVWISTRTDTWSGPRVEWNVWDGLDPSEVRGFRHYDKVSDEIARWYMLGDEYGVGVRIAPDGESISVHDGHNKLYIKPVRKGEAAPQVQFDGYDDEKIEKAVELVLDRLPYGLVRDHGEDTVQEIAEATIRAMNELALEAL